VLIWEDSVVDRHPYHFIGPRDQGYVWLVIGLVIRTGVFAQLAMAVAPLGALANDAPPIFSRIGPTPIGHDGIRTP
jgi:hypothetical protein